MKKFISFLFNICLLISSSITYAQINRCANLALLQNAINIGQVIVVQPTTGIFADLTLCQRNKTGWYPLITSPFKAVVGKNGVALAGQKHEGDSKTPMGLYALGPVFGTKPLALKMDYRYITNKDKFIDDSHHPLYNQWVVGSTNAKSYESMQIAPYELGVVVNYNMNPIKAGAGSAIFMHLWRSANSPTAGCIALEKKSLLKIVHWLDKAQNPHILIKAAQKGKY